MGYWPQDMVPLRMRQQCDNPAIYFSPLEKKLKPNL